MNKPKVFLTDTGDRIALFLSKTLYKILPTGEYRRLDPKPMSKKVLKKNKKEASK